MVMMALTIWQPWASLIVEGYKPFEFRGWAPPGYLVGSRVVLHAAKRRPRGAELRNILAYLGAAGAGRKDGIDPAAYDLVDRLWRQEIELPFSAGLGSAVLGKPIGLPDGRWAWPMLEVEKWARPIAAKGAQRFWWWRS